jgi:glucose-6-phosphate 1-dehydrogenase
MTNAETSGRRVAEANAAPAQTLLILGASSDLAARLLLPGLGGLVAAGGVGDLLLIGTSTTD